MNQELQSVRIWVSRATLTLLVVLTISSVINLHDMAEATHAAAGWTAWAVAIGIGATLSVMAYVASITDGATRTYAVAFAVVAVIVSGTLQFALFAGRGSVWWVAVAFGVGVPAFEIFLALTDSMLRKYAAPAHVQTQTFARADQHLHAPAQATIAPVHSTAQDTAQEVAQPIIAPAQDAAQDAAQDVAQVDAKTQALHLRTEGYTPAEIARMTGAKYGTVVSWLRRAEAQTNGAAQ